MPGKRRNLSLFGNNYASNGISLYGFSTIYKMTSLSSNNTPFSGGFTKEYIELKKFINDSFMEPLLKRDFENIKLNAFNFEGIINKLKKFNPIFTDAEIFINLIESVKLCIETHDENEKLYEIVYGQTKESTLLFRTAAVEFKPEIQLYIKFFGKPTLVEGFDEIKLKRITNVLKENITITFNEIKYKLGITDEMIQEIEEKKSIKEKALKEAALEEAALEEKNTLIEEKEDFI